MAKSRTLGGNWDRCDWIRDSPRSPPSDCSDPSSKAEGRERCDLFLFSPLVDAARNNNDPFQPSLRRLRSRRLSIPVGSDGPTCKRLISRTFLPHERISLIEAIFTSQDEINAISRLSGDDIQAFIDAIHKVRFHICSFLRRAGLIAFVGLFFFF